MTEVLVTSSTRVYFFKSFIMLSSHQGDCQSDSTFCHLPSLLMCGIFSSLIWTMWSAHSRKHIPLSRARVYKKSIVNVHRE